MSYPATIELHWTEHDTPETKGWILGVEAESSDTAILPNEIFIFQRRDDVDLFQCVASLAALVQTPSGNPDPAGDCGTNPNFRKKDFRLVLNCKAELQPLKEKIIRDVRELLREANAFYSAAQSSTTTIT